MDSLSRLVVEHVLSLAGASGQKTMPYSRRGAAIVISVKVGLSVLAGHVNGLSAAVRVEGTLLD